MRIAAADVVGQRHLAAAAGSAASGGSARLDQARRAPRALHQRQLVGQRHGAPGSAEQLLRQQQARGGGDRSGARRRPYVDGQDAHLARRWRSARRCGGRRLEAGRAGADVRGQRLAQGVELGEVVAVGLDVVAHPVGRDRPPLGGAASPASAAPRLAACAGRHRRGRAAVTASARAGRVLGQVGDLVARHGQVAEQRIGEDLGQVRLVGRVRPRRRRRAGRGRRFRPGAAAPARGHRPLVALQVVEVAGRDAEVLGHLGLGQAELAPQPLEPAAEEQLSSRVDHAVTLSQFYRAASQGV